MTDSYREWFYHPEGHSNSGKIYIGSFRRGSACIRFCLFIDESGISNCGGYYFVAMKRRTQAVTNFAAGPGTILLSLCCL